jgi:hypothetical protein
MKSAFKVKAIQRIAGVIAIVAIIGFSMAACSDGSGGGNKILGLPYNLKFEHKDNSGGEVTSYILDCSYDEALQILTKKFGVYGWQQCSALATDAKDFDDYRAANPDWVAFQDCVDVGDYRLVHAYAPIKGESDGRAWDKPYEQEGSIKITGMPEWCEGNVAYIQVIEYLNGVVDLKPGWENRAQHRKAFCGGTFVSNGIADIPLEWFPSKRYDRKSGTYKHGERYTIFLYISNEVPRSVARKIQTLTFTNGHADLDFKTFEEAPEYN